MTLLKGSGVGGTVGTEQQYAEDRWSSLQMHLEATSHWGIAKNTERRGWAQPCWSYGLPLGAAPCSQPPPG